MQMIWHARHFLPPSTSSFSYSFKTVIRIPNSGICFQIWLAPQQEETWGRNTWACWEPWPKSSSEPGRDVRGPVGPNCGPFCWPGPANPGISLSLSCSLQSYVNTPKQIALFAFQSPASTLEDSKVMLIRENEESTEQNMVQGGTGNVPVTWTRIPRWNRQVLPGDWKKTSHQNPALRSRIHPSLDPATPSYPPPSARCPFPLSVQ